MADININAQVGRMKRGKRADTKVTGAWLEARGEVHLKNGEWTHDADRRLEGGGIEVEQG